MSGKPTLYLIDGNSYIYRAYYALPHLSNSKGLPTNAILGFTNMLLKVMRDDRPDYFAVTFDVKGPTFREEEFKGYKIHRPKTPPDLLVQIPYIKEIVKGFGIPVLELQGYEADDVLGTLSRRGENDYIVFIITGDKDAFQLISDSVFVIREHKDRIVYNEEKVMERYGVKPFQIPDLMGLMGDKIDNIPGVPGIGEKKATALIKEFSSLENLLANIDKIASAALRCAIEENRDQAILSKRLATIMTDCPIEVDWADLKMGKPNRETLLEIFRELDFSALMKQFAPSSQHSENAYKVILDKVEFDGLCARLQNVPAFSIDLETTDKRPMWARIVGISLSYEEHKAYYIPVRHSYQDCPEQLDPFYVLDKLRPVIENPGIKKYGQNIKYDMICLEQEGIHIQGLGFDTMIASYVLNPTKHNHNLEQISLEYLGHKPVSYTEVTGTGKQAKRFDEVPVEKAGEYSCEDADLAFLLTGILKPKIEEESLTDLYYDLELPLVEVLAEMEKTGVRIDPVLLSNLSKEIGIELDRIIEKIYRLAGGPFNIDSPKQLSCILFERLGLPVVKKTKTGLSTDVDVLMTFAAMGHELPGAILDYRQLKKLKSTYVDALPCLINPETQRVHTSFNQTVTATGRLSSSDPNLQNIPIRTEMGRRVRQAFIPEKGSLILSADYSQIELRILAHLSQDPILIKAFTQGEDIHTRTACEIFGLASDQVNSEMRRRAKTVNFGIIYGMSGFGLARDLGVDKSTAQDYITHYFERYAGVKSYIDSLIEQARKDGYVSTLFNRRRFINELDSTNKNTRQMAERMAINSPIQGSAADLIKKAMIGLYPRLKRELPETKLILQIHDELLFEVTESDIEYASSIIREEMEGAIRLSIPVKVDINTGKSWAEAH
ncbi:DNA polymerase I [bacterium]|nr:DNA polymerase I [bacterium]